MCRPSNPSIGQSHFIGHTIVVKHRRNGYGIQSNTTIGNYDRKTSSDKAYQGNLWTEQSSFGQGKLNRPKHQDIHQPNKYSMCPEGKRIGNRMYGDNPLKDIEKKVFDSSKIWESFGIDQKGECHDCCHQSDKNPKAD